MTDTHVDPNVPDPAEVDTETESRAKRLGWVPKEEFKGDPARWRPADEFMRRGETILPIVLKNNEQLQTRLSTQEVQLREAQEVLVELRDRYRSSEDRAYKRAKAELEAEMKIAVDAADPKAYDKAKVQLDALETEKPKPVTERKADTPVADPVIQGWISDNGWFNKDRALNVYAIEVFGELENTKPGMSKTDMLAETKQKVIDKFPEKFGINPRREGAPAVATPGAPVNSRTKRAQSYDDLPAEAKQACDKYVRTIPGYKREEYVKDYFAKDSQ